MYFQMLQILFMYLTFQDQYNLSGPTRPCSYAFKLNLIFFFCRFCHVWWTVSHLISSALLCGVRCTPSICHSPGGLEGVFFKLHEKKQWQSICVSFSIGFLLFFSVLLNYLAQNWDKVGSRLDKKLFQSTLRSFSITNEELATQGRNSIDGYQECVAVCKVRPRIENFT